MFGQAQSDSRRLRRTRRIEFCIVLVAALAGVVTSLCFFNGSIREIVGEQILGFLREDTEHRRNTVDNILRASMEFVQTRATFLAGIADLKSKETQYVLRAIPRDTAIKDMNIVTSDTMGNIDGRCQGLFHSAMKGVEGVVYLPSLARNDKDTLVFAAPIRQGKVIRGVLYARYIVNKLKNDIRGPSFGNAGGFCVVDERDIVVLSDNAPLAVEGASLRKAAEQQMGFLHKEASLAVLFHSVVMGRDGVLRFSLDDNDYYMMYMPCRSASWYVVSFVPARIMDGLFYSVAHKSHLLALTLCLCICFLMGYVFLLKRRQLGEERMASDRLRFIMEQSDLLALEWDMTRNLLTFSEPGRKVLGLSEASCPLSEMTGGEAFVHPDDMIVWRRLLHALRNGAKRGGCELRLRTASGAYQWFSCKVCVLFGAGGKAMAAIGVMIDIHEHRQRMDRLSQKLEQDSGTGLYNKKTTERRISDFLAAHQGETEECPLIMVDLDKLKHINDTYGHDAGDMAIRAVAQTLRAGFRENDVVGRIGDDEFLVFVTSPMTVDSLQRKLTHLQRSISSYSAPKGCAAFTVSIGVAFFPRHGASFAELFKRADQAIYEAKRAGRGCFILAGEETRQ